MTDTVAPEVKPVGFPMMVEKLDGLSESDPSGIFPTFTIRTK